ncbi:RNA polymerase II subunit A C-terminal domain phosphatase-like [Tripterygium wilfordii]|nr:RNA polymerase II subunit A C-terminal domain phosphatase-like [Tripterygium wilfordii]
MHAKLHGWFGMIACYRRRVFSGDKIVERDPLMYEVTDENTKFHWNGPVLGCNIYWAPNVGPSPLSLSGWTAGITMLPDAVEFSLVNDTVLPRADPNPVPEAIRLADFIVAMEVGGYCSVDRTMCVCSAMEALALETVGKSLAFVLMMAGSLLNDVRLIATDERFPVDELHKVKRPDPENKDSSDTEDDEDDEDVNDEDDDDAGDEDFSGEELDEEGDPEDDPEVNGGGGSSDDDDEDEDDDDGDEDDADEDGEEEEDEDEDEEVPQPPAKKRK